jgi:hypothetical protein
VWSSIVRSRSRSHFAAPASQILQWRHAIGAILLSTNMGGLIQAMTRLIVAAAIAVTGLVSAAGAPRDAGSRPAPGQKAAPAPLSGPLRDHVRDERFGIVTSVRGLPLGVRDELQRLFESPTLDIADPGAASSRSDVADPRLPSRRLVVAGCSPDHHCFVYYERAGIDHTWRLALFRWTPGETRFEWGGTAPSGLATIEDVRRAILSGAIKGPAVSW